MKLWEIFDLKPLREAFAKRRKPSEPEIGSDEWRKKIFTISQDKDDDIFTAIRPYMTGLDRTIYISGWDQCPAFIVDSEAGTRVVASVGSKAYMIGELTGIPDIDKWLTINKHLISAYQKQEIDMTDFLKSKPINRLIRMTSKQWMRKSKTYSWVDILGAVCDDETVLNNVENVHRFLESNRLLSLSSGLLRLLDENGADYDIILVDKFNLFLAADDNAAILIKLGRERLYDHLKR